MIYFVFKKKQQKDRQSKRGQFFTRTFVLYVFPNIHFMQISCIISDPYTFKTAFDYGRVKYASLISVFYCRTFIKVKDSN